jgi:CheY-like chemotaxis protein
MRARGDQTPLIFLTGYADHADTSLMSLGAEAVLGKPVVLEELTRLLASLPSR